MAPKAVTDPVPKLQEGVRVWEGGGWTHERSMTCVWVTHLLNEVDGTSVAL